MSFAELAAAAAEQTKSFSFSRIFLLHYENFKYFFFSFYYIFSLPCTHGYVS